MKDLNLPTTYEAWDWDKDFNTIKAYHAITNQGYTATFKIEVWNNLCTKLYQTLFAMGLDWDNKYTSYSETLLSGSFPPLTAKIFNSVRHNIEVHVPTTWKWKFDQAFNGYVGKVDFIGASNSNNPDTLFGSYIVEIARKLNLLISIFKNEASFVEPLVNCEYTINTANTIFSCLKSILLNIDFTFELNQESLVSAIEPKKMTVNTLIESYKTALLKLRSNASSFVAHVNPRTISFATLILEVLYSNLVSYLLCNTSSNTELKVNSNIVRFIVETNNQQSISADIILRNIIYMITNLSNYQFELGTLISLDSIALSIDYYSSTVEEATIKVMWKRILSSQINHESNLQSSMNYYVGEKLYSIVLSTLLLKRSTLSSGIAKRMISGIFLDSIINPLELNVNKSAILSHDPILSYLMITNEMHSFERLLFSSNISSDSEILSTFIICHCTKFDGLISSYYDINFANMKACLVNPIESITFIEGLIIADLKFGLSTRFSTSVTMDLFVDEASLENYKDAYNTTINETIYLVGTQELSILKYYGDCLITREDINSILEGNVTSSLPYFININQSERENSIANIRLIASQDTLSILINAFIESFSANLAVNKFIALDSILEVESDSQSVIGFDISWYNPELVECELSIYQVYDIIQNNEILLLDCEE